MFGLTWPAQTGELGRLGSGPLTPWIPPARPEGPAPPAEQPHPGNVSSPCPVLLGLALSPLPAWTSSIQSPGSSSPGLGVRTPGLVTPCVTEAGPPPSEPGWTEASSLTSSWLAACHPSLPSRGRAGKMRQSRPCQPGPPGRAGGTGGPPHDPRSWPPAPRPPSRPAALDAPKMRVVLAPALAVCHLLRQLGREFSWLPTRDSGPDCKASSSPALLCPSFQRRCLGAFSWAGDLGEPLPLGLSVPAAGSP